MKVFFLSYDIVIYLDFFVKNTKKQNDENTKVLQEISIPTR